MGGKNKGKSMAVKLIYLSKIKIYCFGRHSGPPRASGRLVADLIVHSFLAQKQ